MRFSDYCFLAIIFSGLVLSLFTAIEHITGRPKEKKKYFRSIRGLIISILLAQITAIGFGFYHSHPWVLFLFFTLLYVSGPLEYIRYYRLIKKSTIVPATVKLSLLPAIPLCLYEIYIHLFPSTHTGDFFQTLIDSPLKSPLFIVLIFSLIGNLLYSTVILYSEISAIRRGSYQKPQLFSMGISIVSFIFIIISSLFIFTGSALYIKTGALGIALIFIIYFLFKNRFPDYFQLVVKEIKLKRYKRTLLNGIDNKTVNNRLTELMENEKLYREMDLRMKVVAERLLITPHQFSQLLNENNKTDFRNYVNNYRINEAKQLLINDLERSIISICFEVGFSSKTSFNITFKKMTGLSPREYRQNSGKKS